MDPRPRNTAPRSGDPLDGPARVSLHPACVEEPALLAACRIGKSRSGGPGGQHRNKVETMVTITHGPTGIEAHAGERRSAEENRRVAVFRLRLALAVGVRLPVPAGEARTALWRTRTAAGRVVCNPAHADYPALLAEALDVLFSCGLDPRQAGARLACTPTQLVRLVKDHPPGLQALNKARAQRGLHPLK